MSYRKSKRLQIVTYVVVHIRDSKSFARFVIWSSPLTHTHTHYTIAKQSDCSFAIGFALYEEGLVSKFLKVTISINRVYTLYWDTIEVFKSKISTNHIVHFPIGFAL